MPGWFKDTLPSAIPSIGAVAVLSIDADLYASVRETLEHVYDLVSPGGTVVLDDYYYWPGCRRAVDEFLGERGIPVSITRSDRAGGWFRKP